MENSLNNQQLILIVIGVRNLMNSMRYTDKLSKL